MSEAILQGVFFAAVSVLLAMVEIQIEGVHGWAEKLPTWRWGPEWFLRYTSRPVTGYHVWMISFLVLFSHLPLVYLGFTWSGEARVLSLFLLMTIFWDVLWFILNPAYGWPRFARRDVWWYRHWLGPFPTDYWLSVGASLLLWMARALGDAAAAPVERAAEWGAVFAILLATTVAADLLFGVRPAEVAAAAAKPEPPPAPPQG